MYSYHAFDLTIASEFPLLNLVRVDRSPAPDVVVHRQPLHKLDADALASHQCILGKLPGIGLFLIKEGREIVIDPIETDEAALSPSVLGPAMSVILRQRGLLVLHASCVAIDEEEIRADQPPSSRQTTMAIAFLGASGSGKSTLAKAFHSQGYKVLTDDVMAIRFDQGYPDVIPSFPQCKLADQAATALGLQYDQMPILATHAHKRSYVFHHGFQETPLRLRKLYVLAKGHRHELVPLSQQAAFAELVRHTRAVNIMQDEQSVTAHFQHCATLLQTIPVSQFVRRPALVELPELVQLVRDDLGSSSPQICRPSSSCLSV